MSTSLCNFQPPGIPNFPSLADIITALLHALGIPKPPAPPSIPFPSIFPFCPLD
jgi:hypothetical protein